MKRRDFLISSAAAAGLGSLLAETDTAAQESAAANQREIYELKLYHLRRGPQPEMFDRYYRNAAIPALNRAGIKRVGVFSVMVGPESPTMYVLLAHPSIESVITTPEKLLADADYLKAGAEFMYVPASEPAYIRVDSSLMRAFAAMPQLEPPSFGEGNKTRIFELRTYESPSKKANRKKIEMFEKAEIGIFHHVGLTPVFFGENLIATRLPSLTYMLAYENQAAHDKGWAAFGADPDWKKLRTTPGYTDNETVSNISNVLLRPTSYSQI